MPCSWSSQLGRSTTRRSIQPAGVLRAERNLSRQDLAAAVGVNYQTIGYLERGEFNPSLELALRTAEFFGLPVEAVFSRRPFARCPPSCTAAEPWSQRPMPARRPIDRTRWSASSSLDSTHEPDPGRRTLLTEQKPRLFLTLVDGRPGSSRIAVSWHLRTGSAGIDGIHPEDGVICGIWQGPKETLDSSALPAPVFSDDTLAFGSHHLNRDKRSGNTLYAD
jgi:putative transcriptional regulator